jgi:hypothetical protein
VEHACHSVEITALLCAAPLLAQTQPPTNAETNEGQIESAQILLNLSQS